MHDGLCDPNTLVPVRANSLSVVALFFPWKPRCVTALRLWLLVAQSSRGSGDNSCFSNLVRAVVIQHLPVSREYCVTSLCITVWVKSCVLVCDFVRVCVRVCVCMCVYANTHACLCACYIVWACMDDLLPRVQVYIYICVCVWVCVCVYVCVRWLVV